MDSLNLENTSNDNGAERVASKNMANADNTTNTAEFTLFPRLPNEIQAEIWRQAVDDAEKPPRIIQIRNLNGGREFTASRQHAGIPVPPLLVVCHASRRIAQKVFDRVEREFWPLGDERKTSDYPVEKEDILYIGTANDNAWEVVLGTGPPDEYGMPDCEDGLDKNPICSKCNIAVALELAVLFPYHYYLVQARRHLIENGLKLYFVVENGSEDGPFRFTRRLCWERYQWFGALYSKMVGRYGSISVDDGLNQDDIERCIVTFLPTCNRQGFEVVEAVGNVVGQWTYGMRLERHRLLMRAREGFSADEQFLNG